jgi:hypothetical protein
MASLENMLAELHRIGGRRPKNPDGELREYAANILAENMQTHMATIYTAERNHRLSQG